MSICQRCASASRDAAPPFQAATLTNGRPHRHRAFTLIELLVVIAIISMLISILLPSLSTAREQARMAVCGQRLREFANGLSIYFAENHDYIPGMNTTGLGIEQYKTIWSSSDVLSNGKVPVQTSDWMTPILAPQMELPANRAERFKFLFEEYGCPSQIYTSIIYYNSGGPDVPEHEALAPYKGASYKMPAYMQYWSPLDRDETWKQRTIGWTKHPHAAGRYEIRSHDVPGFWSVEPADFQSRLSQVGPPARKVFCADGTRYVDATKILDHDISPTPSSFGAFTTSGAWWSGSTAYGVKSGTPTWGSHTASDGSPSEGANLAVSYRHGRQRGVPSGSAKDNAGTINACFFDGHVERMTDKESREPHLWYPSGSRIRPGRQNDGMTDVHHEQFIP